MDTPMHCHEERMHQAIALANRSLPQDVPVGAMVVDQSRCVIAEGWNNREQNFDPTGHAEMVALRQAGLHRQNWRLNDCVLYVTLEPCPMCASAILQARVSGVVFGAYDVIQGALGSALDLSQYYEPKPFVIGGVEEAACHQQLEVFFKARRQAASH